MNHKALINRFVWPGLPFCARLNIKPCPDLVIIGLPITSSSDSISTSLSLSSESLSYSSTWLKSAFDARVSCGTVASLTKLNTDTSETAECFSEEAVGVCSTWSVGKKTPALALGFAFDYTARGRAPALSLVVSLLTVL